MPFIVTEKAMRPASTDPKCFYCRKLIGSEHAPDCVLIMRKAKVRMIVEYDINVPADWDSDAIEFHRNESSWCAGNAIEELKALNETNGCICGIVEYEFVEHIGEPFLQE